MRLMVTSRYTSTALAVTCEIVFVPVEELNARSNQTAVAASPTVSPVTTAWIENGMFTLAPVEVATGDEL